MNKIFMLLLFVKLIAGCSHSPEGAPTSTKVANVVKDTVSIASGNGYAVSRLPHNQTGIYTRVSRQIKQIKPLLKVLIFTRHQYEFAASAINSKFSW
jgi:hypothetical protein